MRCDQDRLYFIQRALFKLLAVLLIKRLTERTKGSLILSRQALL